MVTRQLEREAPVAEPEDGEEIVVDVELEEEEVAESEPEPTGEPKTTEPEPVPTETAAEPPAVSSGQGSPIYGADGIGLGRRALPVHDPNWVPPQQVPAEEERLPESVPQRALARLQAARETVNGLTQQKKMMGKQLKALSQDLLKATGVAEYLETEIRFEGQIGPNDSIDMSGKITRA